MLGHNVLLDSAGRTIRSRRQIVVWVDSGCHNAKLLSAYTKVDMSFLLSMIDYEFRRDCGGMSQPVSCDSCWAF